MALIKAENDDDNTLPISQNWRSYKKELDRVAAAIERASAVTDRTNGQRQDLPDAAQNVKSINLSFKNKVWWKIPGDACCTWEVYNHIRSLQKYAFLILSAHGNSAANIVRARRTGFERFGPREFHTHDSGR
jgi:hypothetical protein